MKRALKTDSHRRRGWMAASAATVLALIIVSVAAVWAQSSKPPFRRLRWGDPETFQYRDLTKELANKMTETFTVAAVGDVLWQEPKGKRISPALKKILQEADTTVGNMESYIIDRRFWEGSRGYGNNYAPKNMADELADLGFDMMAPGEGQGGEAGWRETVKYLDEVGIKVSGIGPNLTIARQPVFQELEQGRVAFIGALTTGVIHDVKDAATNKVNNLGDERWGVNPLRLTQWRTVTRDQFKQLKAIQDSIDARRSEPDVCRPNNVPSILGPDRLQVLDTIVMVGEKPGEYYYEMDPTDEEAQILATRNAKEYADFAIFSMHVHENRYMFQYYSQDNYPTNYLIELTHKLVDNGMDMYVGHGNHTIQGVEIYKGRPIFYNLGNFAVHRWGIDDSPPGRDGMTNIERTEVRESWLQEPENLIALVATSKYQDGKLVEVRLYPVDLGHGLSRPWSRMSIAQTPSPELAQDILSKVQKYSEPFGTKIAIENGVGVIRVLPEATVPVGADIRATFKK